jgi:hypothetical protein
MTSITSINLSITKITHPATLIPYERLRLDTCCPQAKVKIIQEAETYAVSHAIENVNIGTGGSGVGHQEFTTDGKGAYANALAYLVTNNELYAENTMKILNGWSTTCKTFVGTNAPLEAAWGTAAMARACELLKWTCPKWNKTIEEKYKTWVRSIILPHLRGDTERYHLNWGFYNNWHTSINEARLQFALLCDDLIEVNACLQRYVTIFESYVQDTGITGETYRDSDHCCFGLAGLIQTCELAWHQGVDLYALRNNLLQKSIELHAGIFGSNIFPVFVQRTKLTVYNWIQPSGWGIAYQHFVQRREKSMPLTLVLLQKIRPTGFALHWGYDTLTHV